MSRISEHGSKTFEREMTDEPHLPRFLVRRGAKRLMAEPQNGFHLRETET
jgi:hypothetical protein